MFVISEAEITVLISIFCSYAGIHPAAYGGGEKVMSSKGEPPSKNLYILTDSINQKFQPQRCLLREYILRDWHQLLILVCKFVLLTFHVDQLHLGKTWFAGMFRKMNVG